MISKSTITEVDIHGNYSWSLICEIDNIGGGEYVREHSIVSTDKFTKIATTEAIKRALLLANVEFKPIAGDSFKLLNVSSPNEPKYIYHQDLLNKLVSSDQDASEDKVTGTQVERIQVPPGTQIKEYQLKFEAPGIEQSFPITTTTIEGIPMLLPITLRFTVEVSTNEGPICDGCTFALLTHHGNYVSATKDIKDAPVNLAKSVGDTEKWTFVRLHDDIYGVRSVHGTYLSAIDGGEGTSVRLQYDRHNWSKMSEEQWKAVVAPTGKIAFRSTHGTFLRSHRDRNLVDIQIDRHNWGIMRWEQYTLVPVDTVNSNDKSEL